MGRSPFSPSLITLLIPHKFPALKSSQELKKHGKPKKILNTGWGFLSDLLGFLIPKKSQSKGETIPKNQLLFVGSNSWFLLFSWNSLVLLAGERDVPDPDIPATLPGIKFALGEILLGCSIPGWKGWNLGLKLITKLLPAIINYPTDLILNNPNYPSCFQQKAGRNLGTTSKPGWEMGIQQNSLIRGFSD